MKKKPGITFNRTPDAPDHVGVLLEVATLKNEPQGECSEMQNLGSMTETCHQLQYFSNLLSLISTSVQLQFLPFQVRRQELGTLCPTSESLPS